ncbi:MAG: 7TM-DISM domain-containing protein [Spirochaetota bacterium]
MNTNRVISTVRLHRQVLYIFILATVIVFQNTTFSYCAEPLVLKQENLQGALLGEHHLEYYVDTSNTLTIDKILSENFSGKFIDADKNSLNFGFSSASYWFKLSTKNPTSNKLNWFLEIVNNSINHVDLYYMDAEGSYRVQESGDMYPVANRAIQHVTFIFPMTDKPGSSEYYIHISSFGSIAVPFKAWSYIPMFESIKTETAVMVSFLFILLVMGTYNLFMFVMIRKATYFYYTSLIFSLLMLFMVHTGYGNLYLFPQITGISIAVLPLQMLTCVMALLFTRTYFEIKQVIPWLNRYFIMPGIIINAFTGILFYPLVKVLSPDSQVYLIVGTMIIAILTIILCIACGFIFASRKSRKAVFYLVAFFAVMVGGIVHNLWNFGILPTNFFTYYGVYIAIVCLVILFSIGLGDDIHRMRMEVLDLNKNLQEKERISTKRAQYLESIITLIKTSARELFGISSELNNLSNTLTSISNEEASTAEELSASFEELTSATLNISSAADHQKSEVGKTKELILHLKNAQEKVGRANESVIGSMQIISQATGETERNLVNMLDKINIISDGGESISNFVTMIDNISDQTNLLSLNAAIEAARAGNAGKGFTVVADEIGKLASATSENSKQIANEIFGINNDIQEGVQIVNTTKESTKSIIQMAGVINDQTHSVISLMENQQSAMKDVEGQSTVVDDLSSEIAVSARQQSSSMNEAMGMIERISQTSQNLANHNSKILDLTDSITQKAKDLEFILHDSMADEMDHASSL